MRRERQFLLAILGLSLVTHLYLVIRYESKWIEYDSAIFSRYITDAFTEARLPKNSYPYGFAYEFLSLFLMNICGVSVQELQTYLIPILGAFSILIAYSLFFRLLRDRKTAILATFLLTFQPEFLFSTTRSNHEPLTLLFILTALLILVKTVNPETGIASRTLLLLFYIPLFSITMTNAFFAYSFTFLLSLCLIFTFWYFKVIGRKNPLRINVKKFMYASLIGVFFTHFFIFYMFPPSQVLLLHLKTLLEKVSLLFLGFEVSPTPYAEISQVWVSSEAWIYTMLFNWIVIIISAMTWLKLVWDILRKRRRTSLLILCVFYAAIAAQYMVTLFVDMNMPEIKNLQVRFFPEFSLFALPLVAIFLRDNLDFYSRKRKIGKLIIRGVFLVFIAFSVSSSLLRFSHDPLVNNNWFFYSAEEEYGIRWFSSYVNDADIFADFDFRIGELYHVFVSQPKPKVTIFRYYSPVWLNLMDYFHPYWRNSAGFRSGYYVFVSDIIETRSVVFKQSMPYLPTYDIVYNNGRSKALRVPYDEIVEFMFPPEG